MEISYLVQCCASLKSLKKNKGRNIHRFMTHKKAGTVPQPINDKGEVGNDGRANAY